VLRRLPDLPLRLIPGNGLRSAEVLHVDVGAQPDVVGEIPAVVVGVFVDDDLVAVPEPVTAESQVKRGDAEVEAVEPETVGTTSGNAPDVAAAEAAGEMAMLPGVIEVEAGIVRSGVMSDPGAVVVDVRGRGMAVIVVKTGCGVGNCAMSSWWTVLRNESASDGVAAAVGSVLCMGRQGKNQGRSEQGKEYDRRFGDLSHNDLRPQGYHQHSVPNTALTILCRLRYRKDFGGRVVARLMAWRPR
jgi:hypothetical protein